MDDEDRTPRRPGREEGPGPGPDLLVAAVAELSRAATADFVVEDMLRSLCSAAAGALGVDGVGVMVRHGSSHRLVETSVPLVRPLERLQELLQAGPCMDGVDRGGPVAVADIQADGRWPQYQELAAELGVGAVLSVPLLSRGRAWGVLDAYRRGTGPWPAADVRAAQLLADVAVSYVVMAHDRDQVRAAHEQLAHRALHDDLTGLPNRSLLLDRLGHALATAQRAGSSVAVVFLDLDHFKLVNDTHGHTEADRVLVEVAERLRTALRAGDTLARFAGDEFVVVCEGLPDDPPDALAARVRRLTDRLRGVLQEPVELEGGAVTVSASVGAALGDGSTTAQQLLSEADAAMYAAKQLGRDRVRVRDHSTRTRDDAQDMEQRLTRALGLGELQVHYQPIVSAGARDVVAVEALLRWRQSDGTVLPAARFIDVALRAGLMGGIGRWVVDQTCQQLAAWAHDLGSRAPAAAYVNLSSRELGDAALPDAVARSVERHGLRPEQLGLEIVEDHLADPAVVARLGTYHHRGHPLSVDDFGTGCSSLSRLVDLPIALAKMDGALVSGLPEDDRQRRLVEGVLLMATSLGFEVVAEGVETAEQAEHLSAVGCHLLQGFHLGVPTLGTELSQVWAA